MHRGLIILGAFYKLMEVAAILAGPQLLEAILETDDETMGYVYSVCLFVATTIVTLGNTHYMVVMGKVGCNFGSSLIANMFKHTLHRSPGIKTDDDLNINSLCGADFFKVTVIAH